MINNSGIKFVIINRAVPGSGKSSISNCIERHFNKKGLSIAVHSTDNFFLTTDKRYEFKVEKLSEFHSLNLAGFIKSLESATPIVVCDNINIAPWQSKPYTDAARKYGYTIIFLTYLPRKLEQHIQSQQITQEKPDAHGVPEDVLARFISEYHTYTPLLDKMAPVNPIVHKDYCWDKSNHSRIESGKPCCHFEWDHLIEISPDQYHEMKMDVGMLIENLVISGTKCKA